MSEAFDAAAATAAPAGEIRAWPTSVQELAEAERLVLWSFRRWVSGPEQLPMLAREFDRQFRRSDARPALLALDAALTGLSRHARRTIVHHQPCCPCLGADEVCFVSIVAALQGGAPQAARAMAQWLVRAPGLEAFVAPLDEFAACLTGSGLDLPYRTRQRPSLEPLAFHGPALASVH
ncbi:hypothetical protein [Ferrovibrio xuzhouensis]|uniref:Uncharacterized protein n=1 Tax=Ferrovibrio xuzhouensis TaxID=1576914 RepID=A0ABV7VLX2_9PROT